MTTAITHPPIGKGERGDCYLDYQNDSHLLKPGTNETGKVNSTER